MTKKLFAILIAIFGLLFSGLNFVQAEPACNAGCGHTKAAGAGTGKSVCYVTFIAPAGATALEAQVFAGAEGILRNSKRQVAIRGGEATTTRVSVDCSVFARGDKIIFCAKMEGRDRTRTISGEAFKALKPAGHTQGGFEKQL